MVASELSSWGGRAQSHGTRDSAGAHLGREARSRAEERVAALELNLARRRAPGPRGSTGAHLSKGVRSGATGHVAAPKPTSAGRCGPKLQLVYQRVDACPAPCLDLELVCGGTQSLGCQQSPLGPPRERLRTRSWGQFLAPQSVILIFLLGSRRRAHHQCENVDDGPPGGAGAEGPGAPTINLKMSTAVPREERSGAEEHVATPELSSRGGRAQRHRTHGSAGAHLSREARSGAEEHVAAPEFNSARS
jgi:hypothetical protein